MGGLPRLLDFFQDRADKLHELALAQMQIARELELRKAGFEAQERIEHIRSEQLETESAAAVELFVAVRAGYQGDGAALAGLGVGIARHRMRPEAIRELEREGGVPFVVDDLFAEILGAVHYLRELCGAQEGQLWREQMRQILKNEGSTAARRATPCAGSMSTRSGCSTSSTATTWRATPTPSSSPGAGPAG
jgi:hypothetical protein